MPGDAPTPHGARTGVVVASLAIALASVAGGLLTARAAIRYRPSLNLVRPGAPPGAATYRPARLAHRVLLVICDGLRADTAARMPFLQSLASRGASAIAAASYPSVSRPNYAAILTGMTPRSSGVRTNDWHAPVALDHLGTRLPASGVPVALVEDRTHAFAEMFGGTQVIDAGGNEAPAVAESELATMQTTGGLVVLLLLAADEAGHAHGGASQEYAAAATAIDTTLARLARSLDLDRDAMVVTADHGHLDAGGHGGLEPEVLRIPFVLAGAGVERGATIPEAHNVDVAPTVAALLGADAPAQAEGTTIAGALSISPDARRALATADDLRHEENARRSHDFFAAELRSASLAMGLRAIATLLALGAALLATRLAHRTGLAHVDAAVAVVAGGLLAADAALLVVLVGNVPSASLLPTRHDLLPTLESLFAGAAALSILSPLAARRAGQPGLFARMTGVNAGTTLLGTALAGAAWIASPLASAVVPGPVLIVLPGLALTVAAAALLAAPLGLVSAAGATLLRRRA
ncbi:MAG: alkaline phosphatase family protein [Acidobacteriota bacterium]